MWTVSCFPPSSVLRVLLLLTFVPRAEPSLRPSVKPVLYGQNQMFYRFFRMLQYRLRTKLLIFSCNQHCCSVCQCLLPILSALNRGTLTFKNHLLISQQFAALPSKSSLRKENCFLTFQKFISCVDCSTQQEESGWFI